MTAPNDAPIPERSPTRGGMAPPVSVPIRSLGDLPYADSDHPRQRLDLYLPQAAPGAERLPLVVYIHGGAFRTGDKRWGWPILARLVGGGQYAGASIGYRLSGESIWPAQIHDCKAAIRWLRATAANYNIDPQRIGVVGTSAGGHLAAMLGTSGGVADLEGTLGRYPEQSSRVTCVVDEFGPTDLLALYGGNSLAGDTPEAQLIGGPPGQNLGAARSASPVTYVGPDNPPFLLLHGTNDPAVNVQQSERLYAALQAAHVDATFVRVIAGGHGNFPAEAHERIRTFLDKHLRGLAVNVSETPIAGSAVAGPGARA